MKIKKLLLILSSLLVMFTITLASLKVSADETEYYVTYSTDNYSRKQKNIMTLIENKDENEAITNSYYILENVELDSTIRFRVESKNGAVYYAKNGQAMSVSASTTSKYNIYFSLDYVYDEAHTTDTDPKITTSDAHISYSAYLKPSFNLTVTTNVTASSSESQTTEDATDTETATSTQVQYELKFNQYNSSYDEYYLDEVKLKKGDVLTFTNNLSEAVQYSTESESYTVAKDGLYKVLYTPGKTEDDKDYRFNEDGSYGEGEDYKYYAYISEASEYFIEFKDTYTTKYTEEDKVEFTYNDQSVNAYKLSYNRDSNAGGYISEEFFIKTRDYNFNYNIYKLEDNVYTLLDDDNDEDTIVSKIDVDDVDWYKVSFFILGNEKYKTTLTKQDRAINDYYVASNTNNYLFDEYGNRDLEDTYKFTKIEENDDTDLYTSDYEQYILYLTVDAYTARKNLEFYITNGVDDYKDSSDYISLNTAGNYEIIFSPDHIYSRTRHYKYSLLKDEVVSEEININNLADFINFVSTTNNDTNYTENKVFNLTCDLDFDGYNIDSIKEFRGTFNGHFHRIKNYKVDTDESKTNVSLFNLVTKSAVIKDVYFDSVDINAKNSSYVGLISRLYGTIEQVYVNGKITGQSYVGLVSYMGNYVLDSNDTTTDSTKKYGYSYATKVENNAEIFGKVYVGGICGYNGGRIVESVNNGDINVKSYNSKDNVRCIGGLAGYSVGEIISSDNNGLVGYKTIGSFVGGLVGLSNGAFYFSNNYGNVFGRNNVGGIVGYYTTVTKDSDYTSYFGDTDYQDILNSFLTTDSTDVEESQDLKKNVIYYVYNEGNIKASSGNVGGIAGLVDISSTIKGVISKGNVTLDTGYYAGGLIGQMSNGVLSESIAYGNIYSEGSTAKYTGGVVGYLNGTISYVSSYTVLSGCDYIGGIAGGISATSKVISTTSDCYIVSKENSNYVGNVIGYAECLSESDSTFNDQVKYNYYVTNKFNGIDSKDYNDNDAARGLTREEFISLNNLSNKFDNRFSADKFVGGTEDETYPYLICFEELFDIDNFDVTLDVDSLGKTQIDKLFEVEKKIARTSQIYVYMEWNEDDGDLYNDDGTLKTDSFEINTIVRVYTGESYTIPAFMYAYTNNNVNYFDGKTNKYVVAWGKNNGNIIYATYEVITTSLQSEDGFIIVEGEFLPNTTFSVVQNGDNYTLKFFNGTTEVIYDNIVVKVKNLDKHIYICNGSEKEAVEHTTYGEYQRFELANSSTQFLLISSESGLPNYAYVLIGVCSTLVLTLVVTGVVIIVRKKKNKKNN